MNRELKKQKDNKMLFREAIMIGLIRRKEDNNLWLEKLFTAELDQFSR